jgi:hypothetical protein
LTGASIYKKRRKGKGGDGVHVVRRGVQVNRSKHR